MSTATCPIQNAISRLNKWIVSGKLDNPKGIRITGDVLNLLEQIASGRADRSTIAYLEDFIVEYGYAEDCSGNIEAGNYLKRLLDESGEEIVSHIDSANCPTGDCIKLSMSPCQAACPAGIDVPSYLTLIGRGEDAKAIEVIRKDNPLPWICGLVCTRPCEGVCVRSKIDSPISIKYLKAFAAQKAAALGMYTNPAPKAPNGKKICVVGAGPAGLSCAYYLALEGYQVKVIEALPVPGGMLMVGIPRYRLPLDVIEKEVELIKELGVEFSFSTRFGQDITLDALKKDGFDAFFLAIGAHKSWSIGIEGEEDYPNVLDAVALLKDVALGDLTPPGKHVVVIGGGNVAIDAARTSLRLGAETVTIAYRRSEAEMPADEEEIHHAKQEGIQFSFLTIPTQVEGEGETITGLGCIKARLVKKEGSSRLSPVPIDGKEFIVPADTVISAIGQYVDDEGFDVFKEVSWSKKGTLNVNPATMQTTDKTVFAAGDAVTGPATVIQAIAGGKQAARSIDRYLNGTSQPLQSVVPRRREMLAPITMDAEQKITLSRPEMQMLDIEARKTTFEAAETGYDEESVRKEASRCLRCDICRRCQKCVEICRDKMGVGALEFGYMDTENPGQTDFALAKEKCITCGACAENCENKAIILQEKDGMRRLSLCGTLLNEQKILYCSDCGQALPPDVYSNFAKQKIKQISPAKETHLRCQSCRRKHFANQMATPFVV